MHARCLTVSLLSPQHTWKKLQATSCNHRTLQAVVKQSKPAKQCKVTEITSSHGQQVNLCRSGRGQLFFPSPVSISQLLTFMTSTLAPRSALQTTARILRSLPKPRESQEQRKSPVLKKDQQHSPLLET